VAAIRDNDKKHEVNYIKNYPAHLSDCIQAVADPDNTRYTFDIFMYRDRKNTYDSLLMLVARPRVSSNVS